MNVEQLNDHAIIVNEHIYLLEDLPYDVLDVTFYSHNKIVYMPANYIGMCDLVDVVLRDGIPPAPTYKEKCNVLCR